MAAYIPYVQLVPTSPSWTGLGQGFFSTGLPAVVIITCVAPSQHLETHQCLVPVSPCHWVIRVRDWGCNLALGSTLWPCIAKCIISEWNRSLECIRFCGWFWRPRTLGPLIKLDWGFQGGIASFGAIATNAHKDKQRWNFCLSPCYWVRLSII